MMISHYLTQHVSTVCLQFASDQDLPAPTSTYERMAQTRMHEPAQVLNRQPVSMSANGKVSTSVVVRFRPANAFECNVKCVDSLTEHKLNYKDMDGSRNAFTFDKVYGGFIQRQLFRMSTQLIKSSCRCRCTYLVSN
jgi:hypothetical protein